ncbi:hypothetical protein HBH98_116630 [Parastagonospora nodorum]|nr:hypothetical protein HBI10_161880 [Parastagonospora nodorum]KAH4019549.1 hypothetical protein HBI13_126240 [Parastagonospora nodorum]KAH4019692.1 hypothetical protein HBI09_184450 [Parastagonospora nodorum]KAH4289761.1 hypothetical protein HBI02_204320 [Parastagonospora nodorum]KAH4290032.1 hypothetical protein HBI01_205090 [Parastagonospora nodorum]
MRILIFTPIEFIWALSTQLLTLNTCCHIRIYSSPPHQTQNTYPKLINPPLPTQPKSRFTPKQHVRTSTFHQTHSQTHQSAHNHSLPFSTHYRFVHTLPITPDSLPNPSHPPPHAPFHRASQCSNSTPCETKKNAPRFLRLVSQYLPIRCGIRHYATGLPYRPSVCPVMGI